jgi:hypothetical protein
MSDQFHYFGKAVQEQFDMMSAGELFTVDIDSDELYAAYQAAFPEGSNPMFRKQREHECSTCRNFIKNIGNVVSINDDLTINTVWDCWSNSDVPGPYSQVGAVLAELIRSKAINGLFRATEQKYGGKPNKDNETDIVWNHFHAILNKRHFVAVNAAKSAAAVIGEYNTDMGVFARGLNELTRDAVETVLDLCASNNLYKGAEVLNAVSGFNTMQKTFLSLPPAQGNVFAWKNLRTHGALIRNTAIGTLLQDLSAGMPLEQAVKSYEDKVSGTNYKRPTALITPRMVEEAMKQINAEGIEPSLHRRMAKITDVAITDVVYVDNDVRSKMKGGVGNLLMDAAHSGVITTGGRSTDVTIDEFMTQVVPKAKKMEVLVSNAHQPNFMVLTAPEYADAPNLFKWDNAFGWSYDGNITDSIKERVKSAGGKTDAPLRVSLAWFNHDDLDLHAYEPSGDRMYFGNRRSKTRNGGQLDVDMNAGGGTTRTPVENIVWDRVTDGQYQVVVNNFSKRETRDPGYTLELECNGVVHHYSSPTSPSSGKDVTALVITIKGGKITDVKTSAGIEGRAFSQEKWGVKTEQFTRVDSVMHSPNFWGENKVGHKHLFFILEGCKTDVPARGIYNEFLKPEFDKHRKVFEVLGNKMMCEPTADQLAGVGFSTTKQDKVTIRVNGHQLYNVQF